MGCNKADNGLPKLVWECGGGCLEQENFGAIPKKEQARRSESGKGVSCPLGTASEAQRTPSSSKQP